MADIQFSRFESMTNVELRAELKRRGCPTSGNKKDLLAKLHAALQKEYEQSSLDHSVGYPQNETYSTVQYPLAVTENADPVSPIPEEIKTRRRSKKSSVDDRTNEISNNNEQIILDNSNNIEVNSFVSKSNEEEEKNLEKLGGEIHLISVGSTENAKSESIVKEIPLSDEQQRLNQSETINEKQNSAIDISNDDDIKNQNESSKSADLPSATIQQEEIIKETEPEKLKLNRIQIKIPNRSTINKLNLTSELLKTLIPDLSLASECEFDNDSIIENEFSPTDSMTIGELADQKPSTNRTVSIDDSISRKKLNSSFESKDGRNNIMTDEPVRIKDVTIGHELPSQILYIRGLTRPFSLMELKGLLSRYGTLIDGEFWLDKIKSQCFVTYNTLEEAQNAREALDGCRWPSTNPKTLSIRFGRQDEFEFSKTHDLPPDKISSGKNSDDRVVEVESTSPVNGIESELQKEKPSAFLISEEEEEKEAVKTNEQPMKGLDDYFHKTKAKPSIYWLQLTEEQIIERTHRQEQRNEERRKRNRSPSPSNRDSKRH